MTKEAAEKTFRAISDGIQVGFQEIGYELTDREKKIIYLTTRATVLIVERLLGENIDDKE